MAGSLLGFLFVVDTPLKATTILLTRYQLIQFPLWKSTDLQNLFVSPPPHNQDHLPKSAARSLCHLLQSLCTTFRRLPSAHTTQSPAHTHPQQGLPHRGEGQSQEQRKQPCPAKESSSAGPGSCASNASISTTGSSSPEEISVNTSRPMPEEVWFNCDFHFWLIKIHGLASTQECLISVFICTLLKINVLYWHRWFNEEPLTSMKPFHCTKGSLLWKKVWKMVPLRTVHWKVLWEIKNGSSIASLQKSPFWNLYF